VPIKNGYAAMVRARAAKPKGKRRKMDDYETPENVTEALLENVTLQGPILEPAAGSGRMTKVFRRWKYNYTATDLKRGQDFLKRKYAWAGSIVTNPPYRDDLPEAFARKALSLADGHVALLVEGKWLWGSKRAAGLFSSYKPSLVIVLSSRIYFHEGSGKPIPSQFFSHAWVVWPPRAMRDLPFRTTRLIIVDQNKVAE
jgi:hypothetical protein